MKNINQLFSLLFFLFFCSSLLFGQSIKDNLKSKDNFFIGLNSGIQMSGIKSVDFIKSNYSSLIRLTGGKWLNSNIGIQVGYQGRYFNTIADNEKHFYNFYFFEGILDLKNTFSLNRVNSSFYELLFRGGLGLFQNKYYRNFSTHFVLGISNNFFLNKNIKLKFDIGAIVGWDIYQGDKDILPNLSIGLNYLF